MPDCCLPACRTILPFRLILFGNKKAYNFVRRISQSEGPEGLPVLKDSAQDGPWRPQNHKAKGEEGCRSPRNPPPPSPPPNTVLRGRDHCAAGWAGPTLGRSAHGREGRNPQFKHAVAVPINKSSSEVKPRLLFKMDSLNSVWQPPSAQPAHQRKGNFLGFLFDPSFKLELAFNLVLFKEQFHLKTHSTSFRKVKFNPEEKLWVFEVT